MYEIIRNAGEELIEGQHQIIDFLSFFLACERFENSINAGGQSGRLQIQVCKLVEHLCDWLLPVAGESCLQGKLDMTPCLIFAKSKNW